MKSIIYISLITLLGTFFSFPTKQTNSHSDKKKAKVILLLDDYTCSEDQWVYLHGFKSWISGNERAIFDSAFIPKGQHKIELQGNIPSANRFSVLFSKKGPSFGILIDPDSCVIINVEETDGEAVYYKKAIQGKLNNDNYDCWQEQIAYRSNLKKLLAEDKKDSIEYIKAERFKYLMTKLKSAKLGLIVFRTHFTLLGDFPEKSAEIEALTKSIARKFPEMVSLQEVVKNVNLAPMSENSKIIGERLSAITKKKTEIDLLDLSVGKKLELDFPNAEGEKISTTDLNIDYTLVEFWASWCKPCREEMPSIKQAILKHPSKFEVYAVSLDDNREAWQKAIELDSTRMFKHLIGTYPNKQQSRLLRQLNIKAIPTNFLIDKDKCIVAKDLYGENLLHALDSLIQ